MIKTRTILFILATIVNSLANAQRDEHLEFATEIDGEGALTETYNIIDIDTFMFRIENFYLYNGEFVSGGWKSWSYKEFKTYGDGEFQHKVYYGIKDSLRVSYSADSCFATMSGYSVRGRIKHFTSVLHSGAIEKKKIPEYNRSEAPCACLHVTKTNYLIKGEKQFLTMQYYGKASKDLRLKSNEVELHQRSWTSYEILPKESDTIDIIITNSNGDSLYSESFNVINNSTFDYTDIDPPNQNICDNITTKNANCISRSKDQDVMLRFKNYDPSKFVYEVENGQLLKNANNVLEIKWGPKNIGVIQVFYEGDKILTQEFLLVK